MTTWPIFPLGSVLLPGMPLPLQIFEPRYLAMLRDLPADSPTFGVVLIERGFEVGGGDQRFQVGTLANVLDVQSDNGRIQVLAVGGQRFEVESWLPDDPYPRAQVRLLPDLVWSDEHAPALAATEQAVRRALAVASEYGNQPWPSDVTLSDDPLTAAWQLAGIAPLGELDRLTLLRSSSVPELLEAVERLTTEAVELLPLQLPDDPT